MSERALCSILIGREGELGDLEDALFAAGRGEGGIVVLAGDAGLGKTRLASELRSRAEKLGFEIMSGACSEAELSLPYLPFLEAVGNHLARTDTRALAARLGAAARDLAELFPQLATEPVHADRSEPTQGKLRLFEAILGLLRAAAGDHGLLLIVEDLHWADASTRELLDYLTRRLTGNRILVVATYRSDEMHRRHPLLPTVQGWRRSGLARIVELESLPAEQVGEMVRAIFDVDQVSAEFRDLLHERSEGNPFVLEEMLKDAIDRGDVFRTADGWDRKPLAELKIPQSVVDTILLRVERLGRDEAEVIRAAAVLGRTFSYPLLVAVTGLPEQTVLEALEACVRQQLLEEDPGGQDRYRFRHALTREAVYEETIVPRRRQLHARAAELLQAQPDVSSVDLAHHLIAAGRWEEGVPACLRAAEEAEKRWGMAEAAALYEQALPHVGDRLEQARLLCRLGTALVWAGHSPRAQPHLEEGIRTLEAMGEDREAAHYRLFLGRTHWERLRHDLSREQYEQARQALEPLGPSEDLALAYMRLSSLRTFDFEGPEAIELAQRGIEIAEACGSDFARVWTYIFLAGGLDGVGRLEEANQYLERAYEGSMTHGFEYLALNAAYNAVFHRVYRLQARAAADEFQRRVVPLGDWERLRLIKASARAFIHYYLGELDKAEEQNRESAAIARLQGMDTHVTRHDRWLGLTLAEQGRLDEAGRLLTKPEAGWERQNVYFGLVGWVRHRLAVGDPQAAAEGALPVLLAADRFASLPACLDAAHEAFVAAGRQAAADQLLEAATGGPYQDAFYHRMRGRAALQAGDRKDAEAALRLARLGFEKAGYRLEAIRTQLLLADALHDAAMREGARSEARALGAWLLAGEPRPEPGVGVRHGGERLVTVLFADVRGYTELAHRQAPAELTASMASFQRWAKQEVERHHGLVDKFAGDAVMATFNAGGARLDHCAQALQAALALSAKAATLDLQVGCGIAVGSAVVGELAEGANPSVLGEATNLASRLQGEAGAGEVLLSDEAFRRVAEYLAGQGLEAAPRELRLKGFDDPVTAYSLKK